MTGLADGKDIAAVVAGVMALIGSAWALRKRISADKLETAKNNGEGGWITQIQRERDSALARERATWELHLKDVEAIASLTMKNAFLTEKVERMEKQIALVKRLLLAARPDIADLMQSGFGDLTDK